MSLTKAVRTGTLWLLMVRGLSQILSLISVPVIARLLSPDDYGLFGIITVLMGIIEVFSRTGFTTALIQKREEVDDYLDSAWTADLIRGFIKTIVVLLLSFPIAWFYGDDQLIWMMIAASIIPFLQGARSIGLTVLLYKKMDFRNVAYFESLSLIIGTITKVILAFIFQNAWALIIALIVKAFFAVFISYYLAPFQPRIEVNWGKWRDMWSFGRWEWIGAIMKNLFHNGDDLLVGRVLGTEVLGLYRMAYQVANMATTQGVNALRKVLFPALSRIQNDVKRMRNAVIDLWHMSAIFGFGFSFVLFVVADLLVKVFLGGKWLSMIPALRVLTIWGGLMVLKTSVYPVFRSRNHPDLMAKSTLIRVLVMGTLIYPLSLWWGIVGASWAVTVAALIDLPITIKWISDLIECEWYDLVTPLILPLIGGSLVIWSCNINQNFLMNLKNWENLLISGSLSAFVYMGVIILGDRILGLGLRARALEIIKS